MRSHIPVPILNFRDSIFGKFKRKQTPTFQETRNDARNPLSSDPSLRSLLQDLDLVTCKSGLGKFRKQFLIRLSEALDDEASTNRAEAAYSKFRHASNEFVSAVETLAHHVEKHSLTKDFKKSGAAKDSMKEVQNLSALVRTSIESLAPSSPKEERKYGYTKYHMIEMFVRAEFKDYERLQICCKALHILRIECLNGVADRQTLGEMNRFEQAMEQSGQLMKELRLKNLMMKILSIKRVPELPKILLDLANHETVLSGGSEDQKRIFPAPNFANSMEEEPKVASIVEAFSKTKISYAQIDFTKASCVEGKGSGLVMIDRKQADPSSRKNKHEDDRKKASAFSSGKSRSRSKYNLKSDPDGRFSVQGLLENDSFRLKKSSHTRRGKKTSVSSRKRSSISDFLGGEITKMEAKTKFATMKSTIPKYPDLINRNRGDNGLETYKQVSSRYSAQGRGDLSGLTAISSTGETDATMDDGVAKSPFQEPVVKVEWTKSIFASTHRKDKIPSLLAQYESSSTTSSTTSDSVSLLSPIATPSLMGSSEAEAVANLEPLSLWATPETKDDDKRRPIRSKQKTRKSKSRVNRESKKELKHKTRSHGGSKVKIKKFR